MRRKAKELQQARRDAERSGKKGPTFGGFGSGGMTSISSGSIITESIVEPEKPKITPAPVRYTKSEIYTCIRCSSLFLFCRWSFKSRLVWLANRFSPPPFPDQVDQVRRWSWGPRGKRWTTLLTSWNQRAKLSCHPLGREAQMFLKLFHHQWMSRGWDSSWSFWTNKQGKQTHYICLNKIPVSAFWRWAGFLVHITPHGLRRIKWTRFQQLPDLWVKAFWRLAPNGW